MILSGILSGLKIKEELGKNIFIEPFDEKKLNPNSYNLTLHNELLEYIDSPLDMKKDNPMKKIIIPPEGILIWPNRLYLGRTNEYTETRNYVPMIEGRSSIGRLGISIHATAGFGDVGFKGYWTLEISCAQPVIIYPDVEIAQIYYHEITKPYESYDGKYQGNKGVQASMLYKEFE